MKSGIQLHQKPLNVVLQEIAELKDRIHRLENDLKAPLEADFNEQAAQLSSRTIQIRLLEVERANLMRLETEVAERKLT